LFWKRSKISEPEDVADTPVAEERHHIGFDMMVRGIFTTRRGKEIRQCGVTVDGSTRLVTSGDTVDHNTYEALIRAGVIVPPEEKAV
jgi:hypothetical protein